MILIEKGEEPKRLSEFRQTPDATYAAMPGDVKQSIRENLIREQGHLCAYCMSRITLEDEHRMPRIEHWTPQSCSPEAGLAYDNMLLVCSGNEDQGRLGSTCDVHRGSAPLTVNPCMLSTLETIRYKHDGRIFSEDANIDRDLDETLNLNSKEAYLPSNRKRALQVLTNSVSAKYGGRTVPKACYEKLLCKYESETLQKTPYCGILIWWLRKKLKTD